MEWHAARIRLFALCALTPVVGATAFAQTVRPVIVQYNGIARGKIELINGSLKPLNVVLEPMSFKVTEDGNGTYEPLQENIHLKLSTMSFRIPPQQSRFVFYEAKPEKLPAWFVIYSVFAGTTRQSSLNIKLNFRTRYTFCRSSRWRNLTSRWSRSITCRIKVA